MFISVSLKGVCNEIFYLHFFHDSNPSRSLINRLKYFRIWLQFRQDILILKKALLCASHHGVELRGLHHTAESNSMVCITPLSQVIKKSLKTQCASHCGAWLHSLHTTAESSSAVCIPWPCQAPRCASHHRVWFGSVHHTADCVESITYQVSVLIQRFTIAISLWCLKILLWK